MTVVRVARAQPGFRQTKSTHRCARIVSGFSPMGLIGNNETALPS